MTVVPAGTCELRERWRQPEDAEVSEEATVERECRWYLRC
jgi:hypothetical protein